MWCCTMALNGLLNKGVPVDWATHMIGHEFTALFGIDHARTLAIVAPRLYERLFETKKEKLAQFGKRVFRLEGTDDQVAKDAIAETERFFQTMGMNTRLSSYTDNCDCADFISERFRTRGWLAMGERQNITPEIVAEIVTACY